MAEETVVRIETPGPEEISEHEVQEEEAQEWQQALSNVADLVRNGQAQQAEAIQALANSMPESLRQVVQTQSEMIRELLQANQLQTAQLLETAQRLLTPPAPAPVVIAEPEPVAIVEPESAALGDPGEAAAPKRKRFRAL